MGFPGSLFDLLTDNIASVLGLLAGIFAVYKSKQIEKSNQTQVNELQTTTTIQNATLAQAQQNIRNLESDVAKLRGELQAARTESNAKDLLITELTIKLTIAQADLTRASSELAILKGVPNGQDTSVPVTQEGAGDTVRNSDTSLVLPA